MNLILFVDQQLTIFLKNLFPHSPFFNHLFSFFSLSGNSILVWILLIILILILEERKNPGISKKDKLFALLFFTTFILTALIVEFPLKNLFHRPRPQLDINHQLSTNYSCPKNFSFPSGHASTAFAAATVLYFFDKKRKWFYYTIATTIAYSRIYLGCHYFFDVVFGGILGWVIAKSIIKIFSFSTS